MAGEDCESGLQVAGDLQVSDLSGNTSYQVVVVRRQSARSCLSRASHHLQFVRVFGADATSPQRPAKAAAVQVRTTQGTNSTARGTARAAATRTAHNASKKPHAVDATLHDTSYALPNYTVFGRFRFVVDDDRDDDDRGLR